MSLVIAASYNGKACIGGDSGGFNSSNGNFDVVKHPKKVHRINGVLYGLVGSWEYIQIIKEISASSRSGGGYSMDKVLDLYEEKKEGRDISCLAVDDNHISKIYDPRVPRVVDVDFCAIGAGSDWAEGYMHAKRSQVVDPKRLVLETFEHARSYNLFSKPPIRTLTKTYG